MIHKTKKEEGKKHITMPLRWEFQLFRLDSRPNSACFGRFNHQLIRPDMADTARFAPTWADSAKIEAELVRIEPSGRESEKRKKKKKKKLKRRH